MDHLQFILSTDSLPNELQIISFSGSESISELFSFEVHFKVEKEKLSKLDLGSITTENVTLAAKKVPCLDGADYQIKGMFSHVEEVFEHSNTHQYFVGSLVPLFWKQSNTRNYDIFVNLTAQDILQSELTNEPYQAVLNQTYPTKDFICQFDESNYNFISRIASHWGAYFYFDHHAQCSELVLADDINYPELPIPVAPLAPAGAPEFAFTSVRTLKKEYNAVPEGVVISETNPERALQPYQGIAGPENGKNVVHFASEGADNQDEANLLAQIRLEELQKYKITYTGTSGIPCIAPGYVLKVKSTDGNVHEILITRVMHQGNNLDLEARSGSAAEAPFYHCEFMGIPKEVQYRPERGINKPVAVSATARVHSAAEDQTLAQRDENGKYQVMFDFLKGTEKVSNWIRRASHTAKSNHFDMPLTPGTEVQIGFISGNPDRPYILNATENSASQFPIKSNSPDDVTAVNSTNPHHAALITDGMLYTGALKSRQELHITSNLPAADVNAHIDEYPFFKLEKDGTDSCQRLNTITGDAHVTRTYGDRYQLRDGVDFNYGGMNAEFNFGQQYVENHAYTDAREPGKFIIPEVDDRDKDGAGSADDRFQQGHPYERRNALVQKDFSNKYHYHEGYAYNWSAGTEGNGIHKTFNFGGAYVENNCNVDSPSATVNSPTSGFPSAPTENDLITKTLGNTFDLQEGNQVDVLTGDSTWQVTGNVSELIEGDVEYSLTGQTLNECIDMATITSETKASVITEKVEGEQLITITGNIVENHKDGDVTFSRVGATFETFLGCYSSYTFSGEAHVSSGLSTNNFVGGYFNITSAAAIEGYLGALLTTHSGPIIENKQGQFGKNELRIEDVKSVIIDKTLTKIDKAKLLLIG